LAFVGDTAIDMEAAMNAGRTAILATWGGAHVPRTGEWTEVSDPSALWSALPC
jgi:phosphoglycolate phosphatase-like HAD superfamily hydrolase